jgi:hypothetical protein
MSFDYNINNYTKEDLMDIFELPPNYDINIINIKEAKLRDNILKNQKISEEKKRSTINFLVHAKNILLNEIKKEDTPSPQLEIDEIEDNDRPIIFQDLNVSNEHFFPISKKGLKKTKYT